VATTFAQIRVNNTVHVTCPRRGCEGISFPVLLREEAAAQHYKGEGRFRTKKAVSARFFPLGLHRFCPKCNAEFSSVVVMSNGKGKPPSIFGSRAE